MTVIGEVFLAVSPESAGFSSKLQSQLAGLGDKLGLSGGQLAGLTTAAAAFAALAVSGAEFARSNAQIQQETGATGDKLKELGETVRSTFADVPTGLKNVTTAVDELTRRGIPLGDTLNKLAEQELFLSKITGGDLATTVDSTTALFAKFNVPIAQQSKDLDVLFKAQQASGKGLDPLISSLTTGAAALQQFGFGLDKSTALVASLEKAGVNVAPALAALRLAFGKISAEGKDPQTVLAGLIKELEDGQNPARGMADAIKLFGTRSGVELSTAIKAGRFDVDALLKSITDGQGGIVATGKATETLGDQFTLLKNKVFSAIEPVGIEIAKGLSGAVQAAGPEFEQLFASISRLLVSLAPLLGPLAVSLVKVFDVAAVSVGLFATGLDTIASIFEKIPRPVLVVAGAIATFALGLGIAYTAILAFNLGILAMPGPIQVAALAITAIGAAVTFFSKNAPNASSEAQKLAASFSDANGQFNEGVKSTNDAVDSFITAQEKVKGNNIGAVLGAAGSNVQALSSAVSGGAQAWTIYEGSVFAALRAAGNGPTQLAAASKALDEQRAAVIGAVQADIARLKTAGLITAEQVDQIQTQSTLTNGTLDWGAALDEVNRRVSQNSAAQQAQAAVTDTQRIATVTSTAAYVSLVAQLSQGKITEDQFNSSLADLADVSAAAAKTVGDDLVQAMQSFVSTVLGALPTVGTAIDKFSSDIATAQSDVTSALSSQASDVASAQKSLASAFQSSADSVKSAQENLADALKARDEAVASATNAYDAAQAAHSKSVDDAQQRLADAESKRNDDIATAQANLAKVTQDSANKVLAANKKLAEDRSPQAFIDNLNANTRKTAQFMANLQKLVAEGFTPLAAELAKKGPEAAGGLATALADNSVKAKAANSAAAIGDAVTNSFQQFIVANFDPIKNNGLALGQSLIAGFVAGIEGGTDDLSKAVIKVSDHVVEIVNKQWKIQSPSKVAQELGSLFGQGLAIGIAQTEPQVGTASDSLSRAVVTSMAAAANKRLSGADVAVTGQAGSQRADARSQLAGTFAGAQLVFPEHADPVHIGAEISWRLRT